MRRLTSMLLSLSLSLWATASIALANEPVPVYRVTVEKDGRVTGEGAIHPIVPGQDPSTPGHLLRLTQVASVIDQPPCPHAAADAVRSGAEVRLLRRGDGEVGAVVDVVDPPSYRRFSADSCTLRLPAVASAHLFQPLLPLNEPMGIPVRGLDNRVHTYTITLSDPRLVPSLMVGAGDGSVEVL